MTSLWAETKTCVRCDTTKPAHEFPTDRRNRDGRASWCRGCFRDYHREWKRKAYGHKPQKPAHDPDQPKHCPRCDTTKPPSDFPWDSARAGRLYGYCKPCKASYMQERAQERRESGKQAEDNLKRAAKKYGISVEEVHDKFHEQGGVCAICGGGPTGNHRRLVIDHDHASGHVRGLLCGRCNTALGYVDDDPERLRQAATYLDQFTKGRSS